MAFDNEKGPWEMDLQDATERALAGLEKWWAENMKLPFANYKLEVFPLWNLTRKRMEFKFRCTRKEGAWWDQHHIEYREGRFQRCTYGES